MFDGQSSNLIVPLTMCSAVIEIDQYNPDWQLTQPSGADTTATRAFKTRVLFEIPFANVPMVHVGLSGFDIDNCDTARLSVRAAQISATGFDLHIITWRNTRVYKVEISWIALGHQTSQ